MKKHNEKPEARIWQAELAKAVVEIIFWKKASDQAVLISEMLFWNADKLEMLKNSTQEDIKAIATEAWSTSFESWKQILDILVDSWLATSRWDWRKLVEWGWIFLNEVKVEDWSYKLSCYNQKMKKEF